MRTRETRSTMTRDLEISGYKCVPHRQVAGSHVKGVMQQPIMQRIGVK